MTDVLNPEQRSYCMSNIHSKNTKPELYVRSLIHKMGYRYRLHKSNVPGKPDLVFKGLNKVIFVHGCFWHMHKCQFGKVKPLTNTEFWEKKRHSNVERDKKVKKLLKKEGWAILVIWECELKDESKLLLKISNFLDKE